MYVIENNVCRVSKKCTQASMNAVIDYAGLSQDF